MVSLIDEAIEHIVSGKASSVSVDAQSFSMLPLSTLRDLRKDYAAQAADEDGSIGFVTHADLGGCGP